MPKIKSFYLLLCFLAGLGIALSSIWTYARLGLIKKFWGEIMANQTIYPIADMVLGILSTVGILAIITLGILATVSYFKNRNKPDEISADAKFIVKAINEGFAKQMEGIRQEFDGRNIERKQ